MSRFTEKPKKGRLKKDMWLIIGMIAGVILDLLTNCLGTGLPVCTLIFVLIGLGIDLGLRKRGKRK